MLRDGRSVRLPLNRSFVNAGANFAGRIVSTLIGIVAVPIYVERIGTEAFGVVGLFTSLTVIQTILDAGLSMELARRIARAAGDRKVIADSVATFRRAYWALAALVFLAGQSAAHALANDWLRTEQLPTSDIEGAVRWLVPSLALAWPAGMYAAVPMNMERQGVANVVSTGVAIARPLVTLAMLQWVAPTLPTYALAQLVVAVVQLLASWLLARRLIGDVRGVPIAGLIVETWRVNAATGLLMILQVGTAQVDRVVLSRVVPLSQLGTYTIGSTLAWNLYSFITPVFAAYLPRICASVRARAATAETRDILIEGSRLMGLVALPPAATLAFFARETMIVWTGDEALADAAAPVVAAIAIGQALTALHHMPQTVQFATESMRWQVGVTTVVLTLAVPWFALVPLYAGIAGAAWGWAMMNGVLLAVAAVGSIRSLLSEETMRTWAIRGVALPVGSAFVPAAILRTILEAHGRSEAAATLTGVAACTLAASAIAYWAFGRSTARREPQLAATSEAL